MTEITLIKRHGILQPDSEADADVYYQLKDGVAYSCKISAKRNGKFHRKYFALLDVLFNIFEPEIVIDEKLKKRLGDVVPQKNRTRFRKDLAIVCGYYDMIVNIKGEVRAEAKSISFAEMDEITFEALYNKTIDYGIAHIAKNHSREQVENWVAQILDFG